MNAPQTPGDFEVRQQILIAWQTIGAARQMLLNAQEMLSDPAYEFQPDRDYVVDDLAALIAPAEPLFDAWVERSGHDDGDALIAAHAIIYAGRMMIDNGTEMLSEVVASAVREDDDA